MRLVVDHSLVAVDQAVDRLQVGPGSLAGVVGDSSFVVAEDKTSRV